MASTKYCAKCLTTFTEAPERCPNLACGAARPKAGWGDLLGPGDLLDRHYQIVKPLAVGGAGLTYLAREVDASGTPQPPDLAIKVLYTQRDAGPFLRRLSNEAQILQELRHPHIVECRGFVHRAGQAPYLVTLFEHGGSLAGHVEQAGSLPPRVAGAILKQILLALDTAHQRGVVHRDLKPENVLLAQPVDRDTVPTIRVTDFGIAKVQGGVGGGLTRVGAFVGTPEYAAPEQFVGQAPSPATDVFSAGGLVFHLVTGHVPVQFTHRLDIEQSHEELLAQIPPQLPAHEDVDGRAILQDCIDNMMRPDPQDRWTVQQVIARLSGQAVAPVRPLGAAPSPRDGAAGRGDRTLDLRSQETLAGDESFPGRRPGTIDSVPAALATPRGPAPPPPPVAAPPPPVAAAPPAPPPPPSAPMPAPVAPPVPAAHREPSPRPARRSGGASTAVSVIGGMTTALLVIGVTIAGALVVLTAGAAAFGWFSGPPLPAAVLDLDPVALGPRDITADAAYGKERDAMLIALRDRVGPAVARRCDARAKKATVDFVIDGRGTPTRATVTDGPKGDAKACVERELLGATLPRATGEPVRLVAVVPL